MKNVEMTVEGSTLTIRKKKNGDILVIASLIVA